MLGTATQHEPFAKYPDVDEVRGAAAQRVQTYQTDRQTSEQRTTKKFAADGYLAKVSERHSRGWPLAGARGAAMLAMAFLSDFGQRLQAA